MPSPDVAQQTALEVLAANGVETVIQRDNGITPTPVISHAILTYNRPGKAAWRWNRGHAIAQSSRRWRFQIQSTRRRSGRYRYHRLDPERGPMNCCAPAIKASNAYLASAARPSRLIEQDFIAPYVEDLGNVIDMDAIRSAGLKIGVDPLGGSSLPYWQPIADRYRLNITIVNPNLDPRFAFMTVDHDGKIRMDCSSPYAMASMVKLKDRFDIAWGNDPDADRHGIITRSAGLMNPNYYLAVAIQYLLATPARLATGRGGRQDGRQQRHDRPGRERSSTARSGRFRWDSSGLPRAYSMAPAASAAKRAPAPVSSGATDPSGPPTKTG